MEKRTLLAVALSIVVLGAFYYVQGKFFPPAQPNPAQTAAEQTESGRSIAETSQASLPEPVIALPDEAPLNAGPKEEQRISIDTGLATVVLTNAGGDIVSYKLREHSDREDFVEMVLQGNAETHAFTVALGGLNAQPLDAYFNVTRVSDYIVEFSRDFAVSPGGQVKLSKRYDFRPGEYMFELTVALDGGTTLPSLNFSGAAYTLSSGPQFGPRFEKIDQRYEYRHFYSFANGKFKNEGDQAKITKNGPLTISPGYDWGAIAGKYFTLIVVPKEGQMDQTEMVFSTRPEPGIPDSSRMCLVRQPARASQVADVYRFYMGPKSQKALGVYDTAANSFKLRDLQIIKVANTSGFLAPLESLLKWFLTIFYRVIPNYGVAIILLTLLVKAIMFPLTKKSSDATLRMQSLSPKIKEIQDKYKDNPQKMNMEMSALYKKEGYNPLSGCLPMLIQMPIFFAMYNLFNTHFDLRGAMFIPGWIPDLSVPESIWSFAPFRLPILGWSNLRALPFIYVASQLLYGKVTQTPDQQGNAQMKMMLYLMPVMFFFILYDVPSGLLVYWIMSNILTLIQQLTINKYLAKKKGMLAEAPAPATVIVPPKKRKKR
jgi:YidC/Oxa1 family membrane protein insertase